MITRAERAKFQRWIDERAGLNDRLRETWRTLTRYVRGLPLPQAAPNCSPADGDTGTSYIFVWERDNWHIDLEIHPDHYEWLWVDLASETPGGAEGPELIVHDAIKFLRTKIIAPSPK
jgi:hypothetical protein